MSASPQPFTRQKITPFLWFDGRAEEAARFYTSVFKNAKVTNTMYYSGAGPRPEGSVMTVSFELEGQEFIALNAGPQYQFTPAVSFFITCETQEEVDHFWEKLSEGGKTNVCGWLTDQFGVTWQVIPSVLGRLMQDPDPAKAKRVAEAMMKMAKLDIGGLLAAYEQA